MMSLIVTLTLEAHRLLLLHVFNFKDVCISYGQLFICLTLRLFMKHSFSFPLLLVTIAESGGLVSCLLPKTFLFYFCVE